MTRDAYARKKSREHSFSTAGVGLKLLLLLTLLLNLCGSFRIRKTRGSQAQQNCLWSKVSENNEVDEYGKEDNLYPSNTLYRPRFDGYRYACRVMYDGTKFNGWQDALDSRYRTIQGTLNQALSKRFQRQIRVTGASRTDKVLKYDTIIWKKGMYSTYFYFHIIHFNLGCACSWSSYAL